MVSVPSPRIRDLNLRPVRGDGDYVLYWMVAARRTRFNFALQHAVRRSLELDRPLLVLEALRCDYPWASERFHRFILQGMADNQVRFRRAGIAYYPYVERTPGEGKGLLADVASRACCVVTDEFPCFMIPDMIAAGARRSQVCMEAVDGNGLLPLQAADQAFPTAYAFRRFLQRELPGHLTEFPEPDPLAGYSSLVEPDLTDPVRDRWPMADPDLLACRPGALATVDMDRTVPAVGLTGGEKAAGDLLNRFVRERLQGYDTKRNDTAVHGSSGLSPYLHFGYVSSHQICTALFAREGWSPGDLSDSTAGKRQGWWGMSAAAEAFMDQLVTWRELGFNNCTWLPDYDRYESLPEWAQETLAKHASDPRDPVYTLDQFARAETHDPLWNAAQRQLLEEGRIHNYMRMLWGKKILHWSEEPREALRIMIELNNRYAMDGRDPNSYSGIFWVLGRHDRAWGPERPIFGKIRYMTSENTARKMNVKPYLERFSGAGT
jgi:deoxyribodipyrimidine photo-lyase